MYNRYIPQSDGTHRRRPTEESSPPRSSPAPHPQPQPPIKEHPSHQPTNFGISNFIKQILPKDFDIGDLIVILLLLLMAADGEEEQNNALLTMALYLFM